MAYCSSCIIYCRAKVSKNNVFVFPNCFYTGIIYADNMLHFLSEFAAFYCAYMHFFKLPHFLNFLAAYF